MNGATALCMGLGILGAYCMKPRRAGTFSTNATPEQLAAIEAVNRYHTEQLKKNPPPASSAPSSSARPWRLETAQTITLEPGRQYCLTFLLTGFEGAIATVSIVKSRILNEDGAQWKSVAVWNDAAEVPEDWPGGIPVEPESGDRFWVLLVPAKRMQFERQPQIEQLYSRAELGAVSGEPLVKPQPIPNADPSSDTKPTKLGAFFAPLPELADIKEGGWRPWPFRDAFALSVGIAYALEFQFPVSMKVTAAQLGEVLEELSPWLTLRVYSDHRKLPKGWPTLARVNSPGRFWVFGMPAVSKPVLRRPKELIQAYVKASSLA